MTTHERRRVVSIRRAAATTVAALLLAGLLNADTLDRHAQRLEFGWRHDVATAVTSRLASLSRALRLDLPRRAVDDLLGQEHDRQSVATPRPTPSVLPTSPPSARPSPTAGPSASPSPFSREHPLWVHVAGDSVSHEFGQELVKLTEHGAGLTRAQAEFRYSSGLTRPDYFDWPSQLRKALAADPAPRAVVVMFGANDAQGIMTGSGAASFGSTAWIAEYRSRVAALMDELLARGVRVYWVGQPIMRPSRFDQRMTLLNGIYAEEAAKRTGVSFVSTRAMFADDAGRYTAYLPDESGKRTLMRAPDGIHLSAAGGRRLARAVLDLIGTDFSLRH
jgi:hypothetical protein